MHTQAHSSVTDLSPCVFCPVCACPVLPDALLFPVTRISLLLVMEYVEGGTLQPRQVAPGHWETLPEKEVWRYVREVLQVRQRKGVGLMLVRGGCGTGP